MKKILVSLLVLGIALPAFAINEQKLSRKCRKHPEKRQPEIITPVQQQQMTLGLVQRDIKIGTSQADVASILGSPNIVTQDDDDKETWIYDKVSSVTSYNSSGFGVGIGGLGGGYGSGGFGGGLLNVGHNRQKGAVQTVQKTLTIVLKFDNNHNVAKITYHMSTF